MTRKQLLRLQELEAKAKDSFIENHEIIIPPDSRPPYGWYCIMNAIVRLTISGCDNAELKSLIAIGGCYSLYYKDRKLTNLIAVNDLKETKILNLDSAITAINSMICPKCKEHVDICRCFIHSNKNIPKNNIDLDIIGNEIGNNFILYDNTGIDIFEKREKEEDYIDFSKFDQVIDGFILKMKLKNPKLVKQNAYEEIKKNPNISEEELILHLLKKQQ